MGCCAVVWRGFLGARGDGLCAARSPSALTRGRRGIGRALYGQLLPILAERGFHAAFAGIALPNDGSIALHRAMGFAPIGVYREVGWKLGAWRDTSWWQRLL